MRVLKTRVQSIALLLIAYSNTVLAQEEPIMFMGKPAPLGFIPPPLDPTGVTLNPKKLAAGVYALVSDRRPVNNSGFIIGDHGVLVVDPQINKRMAQQAIDAIASLTDKPVLYLTIANHHGDHSFGSYAFPARTQVIAQVDTTHVLATHSLEQRKQQLRPAVSGLDVFDGVEARMPDIVFDTFLSIDLGGIKVEIHHFGAGNSPGDTIVYVPKAKVAWTGNLIAGGVPPIFNGNSRDYLSTLENMKKSLDIHVVVPGHGDLAGPTLLDDTISYVGKLVTDLDGSLANGATLDEVYQEFPLEKYKTLAPNMPASMEMFITGMHRLNQQRTYDRFKHLQRTE